MGKRESGRATSTRKRARTESMADGRASGSNEESGRRQQVEFELMGNWRSAEINEVDGVR